MKCEKFLCHTIVVVVIWGLFNIILNRMQYGPGATLILRYLPVWDSVVTVGNVLFALLLLVSFSLKRKYAGSSIPYIDLFVAILSCFLGISVLAGVLTQGEAIRSMLLPDKTDMFMDFFNSIQYGFEPYGNKVIYPPLINLFYALCGSMIPLDNVILDHAVYIRDLQMGWVVLYGVMMLTILGISVVIWYFLRNEKITTRILFLVVIFCSLPFVFAVERGNSLLQTLLFLFLLQN